MLDLISQKKTLLLRLAVFLTVLWSGIGFFPVVNIEGDAALLIAGCERMWMSGVHLPPDFFYSWDMQPLVGLVILMFKYIFQFLSCEQIYVCLSFILSISYNFLASLLVSKLTNTRWEYAFMLIMFFPESYTIGFYGNTVIFASFVFLWGVYFVYKNSFSWIAAFLFALAPVFRVDVLIIYPVVFFVALLNNNAKISFFHTTIYAAITLIFSSLFFYLLAANPFSTFTNYANLTQQKSDFDILSFVSVNIGFFSITGLVIFISGIIIAFIQNKKLHLFIGLLPLILLYIIYGDFDGAAPKHLHYMLFSVLLLSVYSIDAIKTFLMKSKCYISLFVIFFIFCLFIGVKVFPLSKPWVENKYAALNSKPTIFKFFDREFKKSKIEVVFGAGQILPTADENVLLTGNFFTPFYWFIQKQFEVNERNALKDYLKSNKDTLHIMTTQASDWIVAQSLHDFQYLIVNATPYDLSKGFSWNGFEYINNETNVFVKTYEIQRDFESFEWSFCDFNKDEFLFVVRWDWQMYYIKDLLRNNQKYHIVQLSNRMYKVVKIK